MFSIKAAPLFTAASLAFSMASVPVFAQVTPKVYGDNLKEELYPCASTRAEEYIQYEEEKLSDNFDNIKTFTITEDWRTQDLESSKFPLSVPIKLKNPITGETVGVFDRNWTSSFRVSSFFGRNIIRIRLQTIGGPIFPGSRLIPGVSRIRGNKVLAQTTIRSLGIKNKDGYIVINGCDGVFNVNKEIADALANYSLVNGKAFILLSNDGSTGLRINEIGPNTVKAWKTVYANWNPAIDGRKRRQVVNDMSEGVPKVQEETPEAAIDRLIRERL